MFFLADGYSGSHYASVCAGLGHGIVEAVINPVCAAVHPKEKTTRLDGPSRGLAGGLAGGTFLFMLADAMGTVAVTGAVHSHPAIAYALMYRPCRLPVDERVQAGVSFKAMLQQVGFERRSLRSCSSTASGKKLASPRRPTGSSNSKNYRGRRDR